MDCSINEHTSIKSTFNSDLYQLGDKIGEGGFGQVYKATQTSTQQIVAIKFLTLSADFDADKKSRYIERFHRESDLIRRLNHPNIVQLIDKGQQNDTLLYAVYEYIDGHSLKEQLNNQGPLNATDAAEIMACVLDALSHAHEQGVIHRDIKPANIMLYKVGAKTQVKVLDFGIGTLKSEARQLDYKSITLTQETLGTPSYSAPEQLRGEPPVAQTDIYVWGLVFLECLTGTPTITGSSLAAIFHQQLSPSNVPLGLLAGHSSANFFRRVLNKKAHERPYNTAELYHDFRQLNFSNLVGDLSALPSVIQQNRPADAISANEHDETLVHEGRFSYSRLTERKQISVLSVILTTEVIQADSVDKQHTEQDVIDTFHADQMQQCIDIAIRYGAFHVGSLGDTLLFYFGYPQVTDNDSRLCSRAALDITSNVNKKNSLLNRSQGISTQMQMGMQIGLMLSLANNVPEGKTAHHAMALCRQAIPGQILCTENVKKLLANYLIFDAYDDGKVDDYINGNVGVDCSSTEKSLNTRAQFLLRGERKLEAFGFLRSTRKNHIFIGREQELTILQQCLAINAQSDINDSKQATPQTKLAHIHGEAGIGKSRLVFELRNNNQHLRHFIGQCLPEHINNALYPILNLVKFKYSLDSLSTNNSTIRLKTALLATELTQEAQEIGLLVLSAWLNYPLPKVNPAANLSPEQQKQHLFTALTQLLCLKDIGNIDASTESDSHQRQYLFVFEDLHWADPTSKDFIHTLVQSQTFKQAGHSWCNTSREALPQALIKVPFQLIPVNKLDKNSSIEFINSLFDHQPLSKALLNILLERTDGIPLFIEELASSLKTDKLVHKINGIYGFVNSEDQAQIPASLRESLQQKLDRLPQGKDTAQLAATIGREFDYDLLVAASDKNESQVQADLTQLISAELVYIQRKVAGDSYIFKHALVRDAAYESQTQAMIIKSHQNIVRVLETVHTAMIKKSPLIYIEHLFRADRVQKAFEQSVKIGTQLSIDGHFIYSMNMTEHSLNNLHRINNELRPQYESDLLLTYSMLLMTVKGFGSKAYIQNIENINKLPLDKLDSERQSSVYFSLMINYAVLSQLKDGVLKYEEFKTIKSVPFKYKSLINFSNALIFHSLGDISQAQREYTLSRKNYDLVEPDGFDYFNKNNRKHLPYDLLSAIHSHHALAILEISSNNSVQHSQQQLLSDDTNLATSSSDKNKTDYLTLAKKEMVLATTAAKKSKDPHTLSFFYFHRAQYSYYLKDFKQMKKYAIKSKEIATMSNIVTWKSMATFLLGWVIANIEENEDGLILMIKGVNGWADAGAISHRAWMLALLAQSFYKYGKIKKSRTYLAQSLEKLETYGEKRFEFEILTIKNKLLKTNIQHFLQKA